MLRIRTLAVFLILCLGIGMLGGVVTRPAIEGWYAGLTKPSWTPPAWIFGPVWTVLYVLIGVAGWRIWIRRASSPAKWLVLRLFAAQLLLNAIWSPLFFGLREPFLALVDIAGLWVMVLLCWNAMRTADALASWLFVPYLLWVSFAASLNAAIWWMNR